MSVLALVRADQNMSGTAGSDSPALIQVADIPLVVHTVRRLFDSGLVDQVLVTVSATERAAVSTVLVDHGLNPDDPASHVRLVVGAVDHTMALASVPDAEVLLVHDVLHAFAGPDLVRRVVAEVRATGGPVVPVLPCTDTVKQLDPTGLVLSTPDRSELRVAQTPEGFPAAALRAAGPGGLDQLRGRARTVAGDPDARRLVSAFDLTVAETLLTGTRGDA
ncbi:MAG TPA: 2-C-methyl-D-erythritol 4-phosphate cytidylyltransferase [Pseudonocardiaceae bacterium]|nr:2-C-methyl-D-erythritol 4-phosphate cytidylyltransferase [Pseudonocardiaceae bacterium]